MLPRYRVLRRSCARVAFEDDFAHHGGEYYFRDMPYHFLVYRAGGIGEII